jgi:hypothetical protein
VTTRHGSVFFARTILSPVNASIRLAWVFVPANSENMRENDTWAGRNCLNSMDVIDATTDPGVTNCVRDAVARIHRQREQRKGKEAPSSMAYMMF